MTLETLLITGLAAWRLAFMLVKEDGPGRVFDRLRGLTKLGGLLSCVLCMSVWASAVMYVLLLTPAAPAVYVLAAAGLAAQLHRYLGWHV